MTGEELTFRGRFFSITAAAIRPAPSNPIPVLVGGRSDAALARVARFGDGWLVLWVSLRRFGEATSAISENAAQAGRDQPNWRHTLQPWTGYDSSREKALQGIRQTIEGAYSPVRLR
jgi:alkanesulfonate monooxygenase SsuD/methylene tetrahydromethanopterin reductase-like flavin-dependent oxidoreductase (luciferase family)